MKNCFLIFIVLFSLTTWAQKPIFTTAKMKTATVYFNGAELSHTAVASLPVGTSEIVVKNVSDYLNESTVQIGAPSNVTVLSVQFTKNYLSEYEIDENSPEIKKVKDSIELVRKELAKINVDKTSHQKSVELLDKNQQVSGVNSGLIVQELIKMVDYYNAKRTELSNSLNVIYEKEKKWNDTMNRLNSKLQLDTQKEEKTSKGKLIIQVMNETAGLINFDINYLTSNASWLPFYDLRAESISTPINMLYKAQLTQNTGVDWKKVKLTLSSGNPNQNNQAPLMNAWFLRFGNLNRSYSQNMPVQNTLDEVVVTAYSKKDKQQDSSSGISDYTSITENQLNISFDIDIPYDILSNNKAHSVVLKEIKLPATYKYYAVPRLDKEAFLLAELSDYSKYNLLTGEANIIFEGMYVGKTLLNPNETADTLNLSMGRDKKISIKREKVVDKSGTKFLSAYKEQTFTFDITVRNNKKEEIKIMLKDQYPLSTDKEIEIELLESDKAKVNTETGFLTWDLKLAPNETKKIRVSYKVKYPKDKVIPNL